MRAMTVDGAALTAKGISTIEIDGDTIAVENGQMTGSIDRQTFSGLRTI